MLKPLPKSLLTLEPNSDVTEVMTNVCIDSEEQAHITIHSNQRRNPHNPDYDMSIPLATYDEAMKHPDHTCWLTTMKVELQTMKEMGIYQLMKLPAGHKAI